MLKKLGSPARRGTPRTEREARERERRRGARERERGGEAWHGWGLREVREREREEERGQGQDGLLLRGSRLSGMPAVSPGIEGDRRPPPASDERPMEDRAWERGGEGQGGPSPGWELVRLPHWSRPDGVPAASSGLGGDRQLPPVPSERPVTVQPASGDRSCHRHSNGVAVLTGKQKRERGRPR